MMAKNLLAAQARETGCWLLESTNEVLFRAQFEF